MKKKKLVLILPSLAGGGAEKVTLNLLENIDKKYFDCTLFLINDVGPLKVNFNKYQIINFSSARLRNALPSILAQIKNIQPDIILSTFPHITIPIILIKKLLYNNIKVISREPNMIDQSLGSTNFSFLFKKLYKIIMPFSDKIIVSSKGMQKDLYKKGIKKDKLTIIQNPIDIDLLRKINKFKRHPGSGLRLVSMGRLVYQKGFDRILPIIKNIKNAHITILGEGKEYTNLSRIVEELNIKDKVSFKGFVHDPKKYIAAADYFILPSRWEGLPNSVLESLALGTPVITFTEIIGLMDIVPNVAEKKLILCKDERDMEILLKKLPIRSNNKDLKLRRNLLIKYNTPSDYSAHYFRVIEELLYE